VQQQDVDRLSFLPHIGIRFDSPQDVISASYDRQVGQLRRRWWGRFGIRFTGSELEPDSQHPEVLKMEYRILEEKRDLAELERRVNDLIKQDWKPLGGVCRSDDDSHWYYVQAMIRD
jgi:hypothetical protein